MSIGEFITSNFNEFVTYTGFANTDLGNVLMICVGALFIWLAIKKDFEPLLLVPIGLGIIVGNIPFKMDAGLEIGLYEGWPWITELGARTLEAVARESIDWHEFSQRSPF